MAAPVEQTDGGLPEFFNFPPFFTIQPVLATQERQLKLWQQFIVDWHRVRGEAFLDVNTWPHFENASIRRALDADGRQHVANFLVRNGHAEWEDEQHTRLRVITQRPADVAAKLYGYIQQEGLLQTVFTIFEIVDGEQFEPSEFNGMDETILRRAIGLLEEEGKAAVFKGNTSEDDGVKFF